MTDVSLPLLGTFACGLACEGEYEPYRMPVEFTTGLFCETVGLGDVPFLPLGTFTCRCAGGVCVETVEPLCVSEVVTVK